MNQSGLSSKCVVMLAALVAALFALSVIFEAHKDADTVPDHKTGPGALSTSALGYVGVFNLLRQLDWQVEWGVRPKKFTQDGLLVWAEPADAGQEPPTVRSRKTLLVLPKWRGVSQSRQPKWIDEIELEPIGEVQLVLRQASIKGTVRRVSWPKQWDTTAIFPYTPDGSGMIQLIHSDTANILPLIASNGGILLGETNVWGNKAWILSDPDIMANHGIVKGENAQLMLALFEYIQAVDAVPLPIYFDESIHGFPQRQLSPLRLIFNFPFIIATIIAVMAVLLLVFAGTRRFGQPGKSANENNFGKAELITNTASLLDFAGHQDKTLQRYQEMIVLSTAEALHAPNGLQGDALVLWLKGLETTRATTHSVTQLLSWRNHALEPQGLLQQAQYMYQWREEMTRARVRQHSKNRADQG